VPFPIEDEALDLHLLDMILQRRSIRIESEMRLE
jgi:hypothetical protein